MCGQLVLRGIVSTHSRPKAAGLHDVNDIWVIYSFNTQPPEGGWLVKNFFWPLEEMFQHTAARRRLATLTPEQRTLIVVSTHSRPKAAGLVLQQHRMMTLFQHTAARRRLGLKKLSTDEVKVQRFNTQPPEGGWYLIVNGTRYPNSFNTQPPEGGWSLS